MAAKVLKYISLYPVLARFRFKKDIPKEILGLPVLADFGLWGKWYIVKGLNGLVTVDGREMPFHQCYPNSGGSLIGQRDLTAADHTPHAQAWRESMIADIEDRMSIAVAGQGPETSDK